MKSNSSKISIIIISLIVVGSLVLVFADLNTENITYLGVVESVSDETFDVRWFPVGQGISPSEFVSDRISKVKISGSTKFIRETGDYALRIEEGSDKIPIAQDVTREKIKVNFDQFRNEAVSRTIFVKVFARSSFINKNNFVAQTVYYNSDNIMFAPY